MKYTVDFDYDAYLKRTKSKFYDTNNRTYIKMYHRFIGPIFEHLRDEEELPYRLEYWIRSKGGIYRTKGTSGMSPLIYNTLEELIPMLGYDWKAKQKRQGMSFEQHIEKLTTMLLNGEEITQSHPYNNWISAQRSFYKNKYKNKPYPTERKDALDKLIPLLGYDWKVSRGWPSRSFEDRLEELKTFLEQGNKIGQRDRYIAWLRAEGSFYRDKNSPIPYSEKKKEALDALIPQLGYDWKERKISNQITFDTHLQRLKKELALGRVITSKSKCYVWLCKQ